MKLTWLVVADNSKARIFTVDSRRGPIEEIESIIHAEARLHERSMTSDLPGRGSGKGGARHAYQDEISPKEQENINFAKQIANELDAARKDGKFKQVMLVAAPGFLGNLRNQLTVQTKKLACFELAKNMSHFSAEKIRELLPERLPSL
ncbi:MAG: host attachment protein [Gammaproteobacteria bacterium]